MKKKVSLQWQIARILLLFAVVTISLLFLFQIVLLEPMYENSKVSAVENVGDEIAQSIDSKDLEEVLMRSSWQNDACVVLSYNNEAFSMKNQMCTAFAEMSKEDLNRLIGYATLAENNIYLSVTRDQIGESFFRGEGIKHIIYTRLVEGKFGTAVILIYSSISPVNATIKTLSSQLVFISVMLIGTILCLSVLIYEKVAKPLSKINEAAKYLPSGKYEVDEKTNQYREAQELNQTLRDAARDIQKAERAKRDLISNVSHDLRTPLTMITGYGEMMRDLPGEKTDENIQVIIDESKRLNHLVNDLLDLSKMQDDRIRLEQSEFDLTAMLETEIRKYDVYRHQDGFDIQLETPGKPIHVYADQKRMEQVFHNFMTNAINYSTDRKKIVVREQIQGDCVRVEVQDFGEGIEQDKIDDIWDRYYKIDKEHVRSAQGSGIGLAIVKQILDLHQIPYGVTSKIHEGSTFYFLIPIVKTAS